MHLRNAGNTLLKRTEIQMFRAPLNDGQFGLQSTEGWEMGSIQEHPRQWPI